MISFKINFLNKSLTQKIYDDFINSININNLRCTCGSCDSVVHGYYYRRVKTFNGTIRLRVLRVKCKCCNKTHAVIISVIIPYQSIQMEAQIRIIRNTEVKSLMTSNADIDEQVIYRVRQRFRLRYKTWMSLNNISFDDDLVLQAYKDFKSNYLQVKKVAYSLNQ